MSRNNGPAEILAGQKIRVRLVLDKARQASGRAAMKEHGAAHFTVSATAGGQDRDEQNPGQGVGSEGSTQRCRASSKHSGQKLLPAQRTDVQ
jgi:hypothetical protein